MKAKCRVMSGLELHLALGHDAQRVHVILVAVHHRGVERELGIVEAGEVHLGPVGKDGHEDDLCALAAVLDGHIHRGVVSGALVDDVGLIGAEYLLDCIGIADPGGVDRIICAEGPGKLQPVVGDVGDKHLGRAQRLAGLRKQEADGAAADDGDVSADKALEPLRGHGPVTDSGSMSAASS